MSRRLRLGGVGDGEEQVVLADLGEQPAVLQIVVNEVGCAGRLRSTDGWSQTRAVTVPTREEVQEWSAEERASVARLLDEVIDRPVVVGRHQPAQRLLVIVVTCAGAALLLPWIAYLSMSLPRSHSVRAWNVLWIGFDIALAACLGVTAWWVVRRRQAAVLGLAVTATLLTCDAWFDVCLAWNTSEQTSALVSAALIEFPAAALMGSGAVRILKRSAVIIGQLRGDMDTSRSVWRQRFVMLPPDAD